MVILEVWSNRPFVRIGDSKRPLACKSGNVLADGSAVSSATTSVSQSHAHTEPILIQTTSCEAQGHSPHTTTPVRSLMLGFSLLRYAVSVRRDSASHVRRRQLTLCRLWPQCQATPLLTVRRECDSPEIPCLFVLFHKFNCVGRNFLKCGQLRNDARGNLGAALISHQHCGADQQIPV